ncbi:E3 ubiquitin-protein ligase TRIM71-like [Saccostrea cucullata]|uniref:E3 ubiquitin-protein ligase TRIM71-like n=1 Tax=Saccostrea cuccullata TaxID=36930 RepID=UPI002ED16D83
MESTQECQIAVVCEYCEENNVDFSCSCGKKICEKCLGKHKKNYPDHFDSPYQGIKALPSIVCDKHIRHICDLFCNTCCVPICIVCSQTEHKEHFSLYMEDRLKAQRTLIEKELLKLEIEFKSTYMKLASDNEQKISTIPEKYAAIRKDVEIAGLTLKNKVEETVKKLTMQIEAMEMEHLDYLRDNKTNLEKVIEDIEECKSQLSLQIADPKKLAMYEATSYSFENFSELFEKTLPVFQRSESEFNCLEFLGTLIPSNKVIVSNLQKQAPYRELEKLLEDTRHVQTIATVYGYIFDLSYTRQDQILVCGSYRIQKSFTIRALDFDGKEVMSLPIQKQPNYITQAYDETIFYTSESQQGVQRVKNGTIETITSDNSWKARGLSCCSDDIIVAEHNEMTKLGRLSVYSSDGERRKIICISGSHHKLKNPTYVCVNSNSDICTSDEVKQTVFVFISSGDLKFMYKGKKGYKSFTPRGLATDCLGNILIADYINHAIHVIDSEGNFLRYVLKDINFPTALAIDDRRRLLVGQYLDASIQVVEYLKPS